ncbi:MAG: glycerol-3-phosphate acyltransferase, partial [Hyphomicrobiales bacterium]|nr:glycerol-3-phosphate acyltransferase [Hyphomicrobiales bacterium]
GLGDLVLTCNAHTSRNMSLGMALGRGESLEEILGRRRSVSEGVFTARAAYELGRRLDVSMPITEVLVKVLFEGESIEIGIERLLARPLRRE